MSQSPAGDHSFHSVSSFSGSSGRPFAAQNLWRRRRRRRRRRRWWRRRRGRRWRRWRRRGRGKRKRTDSFASYWVALEELEGEEGCI